MNLYSQSGDGDFFGPLGLVSNADYGFGRDGIPVEANRNNSVVNLSFQYRPCFFSRLNVWGHWTHGWNEAWVDNMDSDVLNYGASFDIADQLTFFAQGDYLRVKNKQSDVWHKASGWAFYTGLNYTLPYGVNMEAGWRHEQIDHRGRSGTATATRFKGDTLYAHLGFDF